MVARWPERHQLTVTEPPRKLLPHFLNATNFIQQSPRGPPAIHPMGNEPSTPSKRTPLQLPNELLHQILTLVADPSTYLTASLVSHNWRNAALDQINRRTFSKRWFSAHCNDEYAPSLIEYTARYIRRHCMQPEEGCVVKFLPVPYDPVTYAYYDESGPRLVPNDCLGEERYAWMERLVVRMAKAAKESEIGVAHYRSVEDVPLDLEDVVLASILCELYRARERDRVPVVEDRSENFHELDHHEYLIGMDVVRNDYICDCGGGPGGV
ncbi:hypothetical protein BJ508DRAFT_376294 [Ascobolus immersus RN42]|uniref:F-box domain-containing protein n=1 Tax=Ascobolus immersus RN42 TaxID=1160509 RepID=A0A3N4IJE3_ASCIM|nr:hypothetical protein BJ508DRAFT_376294 [Ascobolus immersus RN42]